ncbi:MAG: hypothetical protein HY721_17270 [Planctomycetes bacterium]|nr:hypothetical protein [Planctomycetota bacterium]
MGPPSPEVLQATLESVCGRLKVAAVLVDGGGKILWSSHHAQAALPGAFPLGASFDAALESATRPEADRREPPPAAVREGELRRAPGGTVYRHFRERFEAAAPGAALHCLVDVSRERELEEHFLLNFHQLKSMKEIVDILYESLSTPEVVYLCLVAVTAQMGFGFNRAFFLQVSGSRMRGRIGIGPSNHEEAHQIWTRLAALNFSSLREVFQNLQRNGDVPDPRTQELAIRMDFDLHQCGWGTPEAPSSPGIIGALARGKPAKLHASEPGTAVDRVLFQLLSTDVLAVVPLFVRGTLAGVILADNFITRKPIGEGDLNVLKSFAGYAGVALERSHLYDELRESVAKLRAANETLKASQQKLLQAEKLSAIGQLAAYVSHEIRNPLVSIGGLARSLLKDQVDDPDTAETLQIIVSEVTRLEKFLRETLDFVKPRTGAAVEVDLGDLVRDSLATFRNQLTAGGVAVEVEAKLSSSPARCRIDPDLLRHALLNLIKNAIEAMPGGGKLLVSVQRNDHSATIWVGDTGPGIPPEVRPRIFEPFFTTKPEGTGLGLSIASQNIRGLGGRLELECDDTYKTIFKLTLPLAEAEEAQGKHGFRHAQPEEKETEEATSRSLS